MAINEIRELAYGLRPPALDELGLLGAINVKTDALHGLPIDIEASNLPALPAAVEVAAYRIVMEALTNVARHSGATRAKVALRLGDDSLTVDISDNGNAGGEWVPGIGLTSMRERASELGGTVTYRGTPTGSTVTAELPLGTSRRPALHGGRLSSDPPRSLCPRMPQAPRKLELESAAKSGAPCRHAWAWPDVPAPAVCASHVSNGLAGENYDL